MTAEEEKGVRGGRALPVSGFGPGQLTATTTATHEYDGGNIVQDSERDLD